MNNKQKAALNDLQEAIKANPGATMEQCMEGILGALQSISHIMFAVEFECANCCKTISGALLEDNFLFLDNIIFIFGDLKIKECSDKKRQEDLFFIAIPFDKITSFQIYERSCYCPVAE